MKRLSKILLFVVVCLLCIGLIWVRPPLDNGARSIAKPSNGLSESMVFLLEQNGCLVISQSEADIGQKSASTDRPDAYFALALADGISTGKDGRGAYLRRDSDNAVARPGDALQGIVLKRPDLISQMGIFQAVRRYGWPLASDCGVRIAEIHSIRRVQVAPQL